MSYFSTEPSRLPPSCPNVSLFRFLSSTGTSLPGKHVLELGFGGNHGSDLIECYRRGSQSCLGIDINPAYVKDFNKRASSFLLDSSNENTNTPDFPSLGALCSDIASFDFSSLRKFDIVICRDTIYYLSDHEISTLFLSLRECLSPAAVFCVQFIETDLLLSSSLLDFDAASFMCGSHAPLHDPSNPLRYLRPSYVINLAEPANFLLLAHSTYLESYDSLASHFRVNKYLLLSAAP